MDQWVFAANFQSWRLASSPSSLGVPNSVKKTPSIFKYQMNHVVIIDCFDLQELLSNSCKWRPTHIHLIFTKWLLPITHFESLYYGTFTNIYHKNQPCTVGKYTRQPWIRSWEDVPLSSPSGLGIIKPRWGREVWMGPLWCLEKVYDNVRSYLFIFIYIYIHIIQPLFKI